MAPPRCSRAAALRRQPGRRRQPRAVPQRGGRPGGHQDDAACRSARCDSIGPAAPAAPRQHPTGRSTRHSAGRPPPALRAASSPPAVPASAGPPLRALQPRGWPHASLQPCWADLALNGASGHAGLYHRPQCVVPGLRRPASPGGGGLTGTVAVACRAGDRLSGRMSAQGMVIDEALQADAIRLQRRALVNQARVPALESALRRPEGYQ